MASAPDPPTPLANFHSGGQLSTGANWRQGTEAASSAQRLVVLEKHDPIADRWVATGIEFDASRASLGIPFQVASGREVYAITLRTTTEGTAAVGAEEVDVRLTLARPAVSAMETDGSVGIAGAACAGARAEGGVPGPADVAAASAAATASRPPRRVWTPGRSAAAAAHAAPMPPVPCFPGLSSQGGSDGLSTAGPFQGLSAAIQRASSQPHAEVLADGSGLSQPMADLRIAAEEPGGPPNAETASQRRRIAADDNATSAVRRVRQKRGSTMVSVEAPSQDSHWLRCGICEEAHAFVAANSKGLLRHISAKHKGATLDRKQVRQLQYLGKVACAECGTFRDHKSAMCTGPQCQRCTRQRAIRPGDTVPGQPSASAASSAPEAGRPAPSSAASSSSLAGPAVTESETLTEVHAQAVDASPADVAGDRGETRRAVAFTAAVAQRCQSIPRQTREHVPQASAGAFADSWAEALERSLDGDEAWGRLASCRCRLLLGALGETDVDQPAEIKERLKLWKRGAFCELVDRATAAAHRMAERRASAGGHGPRDLVSIGAAVRRTACAGALGKGMQKFVGSPVAAPSSEQATWAPLFLPSAENRSMAHPAQDERERLRLSAWGGGDPAVAKRELLGCRNAQVGVKQLPWATFPGLTAPSRSGERYEHLQDCMAMKEFGPRKRLKKALDRLAFMWAAGALPSSVRWLLDNPLIWLSKERGGQEVDDSDQAWLLDAYEDEILAETNEHGVVMRSAEEVEEILADIGTAARSALVQETLGEEVARLAPQRASCVLSALQTFDAGRLARVLTDSEELAAAVDSLRSSPEAPAAPPTAGASAGATRPKVRPIQMGEFLRKFTCRRLLAVDQPEVLAATADMRQFGCGVAGGAEAIIHFRKCVRALWRGGKLTSPMCTIDIDQENFFGSLDWAAIRKEVASVLPKRGASLAWKHAEPAKVHLDGALPHLCDRGTGQGDVDAPMEASLVQGSVAREARQEIYAGMRQGSDGSDDDAAMRQAIVDFEARIASWDADPGEQRWAHPGNAIAGQTKLVDVWYLDDGIGFAHPRLAVPFLLAFDKHSALKGAKRNRSKTRVSLLVTREVAEQYAEEWQLRELERLADVVYEPASEITLGAETASADAAVRQFREKTRIVKTMLRRLPLCQDAQVELVLQRACLGLSKVNHLLRANGTELAEEAEALRAFDATQEEGLRRLLPGLTADGAEQALRAASLGGVGLARAEVVAAAAHLASLTTALPKIEDLARAGDTAGLFSAEDLVAELQAMRRRAHDLVSSRLPADERDQLETLLAKADERCSQDWQRLRAARPATRELAPRVQGLAPEALTASTARRSVRESGHMRAEPDELGRPLAAAACTTPHVQREISLMLESVAVDAFLHRLEEEDDRATRRLAEILDKHTCHDWLWKIDPRQGSRLAEEDFLTCLASRLGAERVPAGEVRCRQCGELLDASVGHASCCSPAESTRGHYAVVTTVAEGMALADPALQTEAHGLLPTGERPADILTTAAIPGTKAALDITIASQDAKHAGTDACATAYRRKMNRYDSILPALRRAGVVFQPLVWSAEGRPHPATVRILECALKLVRTRKGAEAAAELRGRWQHEIAVAIQRRKAAMIRAALPAQSGRQAWLERGGRLDDGDNVLPPVDADDGATDDATV